MRLKSAKPCSEHISRKAVRTAISKQKDGNIVESDNHGKSASNKKYNDYSMEKVKTHIKSFLAMESHYNRDGSKRQYLASNLNVIKMYELFIAENRKVVEEHFYRKIFNSCFNLGFHQPKKDQCDVCIKYKNAKDKSELEEDYQQHLTNKQAARNLKTKVKERASTDKSMIVAAFDVQKVQQVPYGEHLDFFYKRKMYIT